MIELPPSVLALMASGDTISAIGEKRLIREVIRPLFNPQALRWGVGDDAALMDLRHGHSLLASTDRVPADLTAFAHNVIGYRELGTYLAQLNLSDIAACGGRPIGLLLNMGLPSNLTIIAFIDILQGAMDVCARLACPIVGGDLSDSSEISLSATALGEVDRKRALARDTARAGDIVFASRPIGLTPAAFAVMKWPEAVRGQLSDLDQEQLWDQFRTCDPMFDLAGRLAASGICTSCIDNTDGFAQSLQEIAENSSVGIVIDEPLAVPDLVTRVAAIAQRSTLELALAPGADFSLVGTISAASATDSWFAQLGLQQIGHVTTGSGIHIRCGAELRACEVHGWNYYSS